MKRFGLVLLVVCLLAVLCLGAGPALAKRKKKCDPNYRGACIPKYSKVGDLDCDEIPWTDFKSVGSDPHGFDGDNDGIACES